MSRDKPEGRLLTRFEALLDSHHRTLALWSIPRPHAIYATLAAFDLMMLPLGIGVAGAGPNPHAAQKAKGYHDSLIYAMRFFWAESKELEVSPTTGQRAVEQGFDFLSHCERYGMLTDFHVGYGRGLFTLDADERCMRVRFVPARRDGATPDPAGLLEDGPGDWLQLVRSAEDRGVVNQTVKAIRGVPHHWEGGRLVLDDMSALRRPILEEALQRLLPTHEPPLDDDIDLVGFSARELRAFWHALFTWSMVASGLYMEATVSGKEQHDHLPTQIVGRGCFVRAIAELSGLATETVNACLDRLSFGWGCPNKPDIYLQPLLCWRDHVAWSPHLVQLSKYRRNMLKLMARLEALKPVADNLIGAGERLLASQFGRLLAGHGYQFKTRTPLPDGSGEIDLLAFHPKHPAELLVTEIKGVLGVDEVNEVHQATQQMITGQGQLRNAVEFLRQAEPSVKVRLWRGAPWNAIQSFHGLVVTPDSQPNSTYDHRVLPAVTFETIAAYFRDRDFGSPARIWKAVAEKRWLKKYANVRITYDEVPVGDVVYEIPLSYVE